MNINWIGPINSLGYGIASTNFVNSLTKLGHQVALFPINPNNMEAHDELHDTIKECLKNAEMPKFSAPCIRMWHQNDMAQFIGSHRIGFPIFELNRFNDREFHHLRNLDHIFVCSKWGKEIIQREVIDKGTDWIRDCRDVHVIPLGVDTDIFRRKGGLISDKTIFFNAGKWEKRKGHDVLVECFNKAFTEKDNVELWLLTNNPFNTQEENLYWINLYKDSKLSDKIKILPRQPTQHYVASIMSCVDCGVFLARAEGWNLEALEMLAMGKDLIITDYSAHTEFCDEDNSCLIHGTKLEPAVDNKWFFGQGEWLNFDNDCIEQTVNAMRAYHKIKQEDGEHVNSQGLLTAAKYTWEKSAQTMIKILEEEI